MATPIGTNTLTTLTRRHILDEIVDQIYTSNPLWARLYRMNRKTVRGGDQIEIPLMYSHMTAAGPYQGFELLNVTPQDTIQSGALDWKQYYVSISIDGMTEAKNSGSPEQVFDMVKTQMEQAKMEMSDQLGTGLWSDGVTNTLNFDGLLGAVDDGTILSTYAGINRTANTWWKCQKDGVTTTTSYTALNSLFSSCTNGGQHPTIIVSSNARYNNFYGLNLANQRFNQDSVPQDQILANAGYTNLTFNNVPWVADSHVPTSSGTNGGPFFLNENYLKIAAHPSNDMRWTGWKVPVDQDGKTSQLFFYGAVIVQNVARQGKFTALTA